MERCPSPNGEHAVRKTFPLSAWFSLWGCCAIAVLSSSCLEKGDDEVSVSESDLASYLVRYARAEDTSVSDDKRALELAISIAPESEEVFKAKFELDQGALVENPAISKNHVVTQGVEIFRGIEESEISGRARIQSELAGLLESLDPSDPDVAYVVHLVASRSSDSRETAGTAEISEPAKEAAAETPEIMSPTEEGEGTEDAEASEKAQKRQFARSQAQIHGLLVEDLETGRFAGKVSSMNASIVDSETNKGIEVQFNQEVGPMMEAATLEVVKFVAQRHGKGDFEGAVEIAFENQYSSKDGPSAALVSALMVDSLITGDDLFQRIAITGDMNADGLVKPVGGIYGKIRGAEKGGMDLVAIPAKNADELVDLVMAEGPGAVSRIQIFSVESFEEAHALSRSEEIREEKLAESIGKFAEVQTVLNRAGGENLVSNPHVIERLREVVELAANHESAKILLRAGLRNLPERFSLRGSLIQIDVAAAPLIRAIRSGDFDPGDSPLAEDEYAKAIANLRRVRPRLDGRTTECVDSLVEFATQMREFVNNRPRNYRNVEALINKIEAAGSRVGSAYEKIETDVESREELNR